MKTEMRVDVFTKDGCMACRQTKKLLDRYGIPFNEINVEELSDQQLEDMRERGFGRLPVTSYAYSESSDGFFKGTSGGWSGFRPDELKKLAALYEKTK